MPEQRGHRSEPVKLEVNLLEGLPWAGEAREIDVNEDAWQRSAPPPAAIYEVELSIHDSILIKYDEKKEETWSYEINIEGRNTDKAGEFEGMPNFIRVSTYRRRGAKISTAEGALVKLGYGKLLEGKRLTPQQIAIALGKALAKSPVTLWETDWRASYAYFDKKTGEKLYVNCLSTYDEFPDDPETGGKQHIVKVTTNSGGREDVAAQTRVIRWIGKGEDATPSRKAVKVKAAIEDALDLGETKPNGATPVMIVGGIKGTATQQQKVKPVEDELDLS
jgi:hypothetical protein